MNKALLDTDMLSELIKGVDLIVVHNGSAYRGLHGRFSTPRISGASSKSAINSS